MKSKVPDYGGSSWLTGQTHGKLLLEFQLHGLFVLYNREHKLFLLRQAGGLRIEVQIFGKAVYILTERLGPGKVQMMKEKNTGLLYNARNY